jgi:hypothetical protein
MVMALGYSDFSRLALETDLDIDELRARLQKMTDHELLEFGRAAAYMCTPYANFGEPPREVFVTQLRAARDEWRRRHGQESSPAASHSTDRTQSWGQS